MKEERESMVSTRNERECREQGSMGIWGGNGKRSVENKYVSRSQTGVDRRLAKGFGHSLEGKGNLEGQCK